LYDFRSTHGGNLPLLGDTGKSCGSRPLNTAPEIKTSSPTFSARIFSSVNGKVNLIMAHISIQIGPKVQRTENHKTPKFGMLAHQVISR
jgi:hypothetical protein